MTVKYTFIHFLQFIYINAGVKTKLTKTICLRSKLLFYCLLSNSTSTYAIININSGNNLSKRGYVCFYYFCLFVLVLLLAVVVHRKKTDDLYKDTDDIRENIINYEDEGGGEGDMTGYDLNVLRLMYDDPLNEKQMPNNSHLIPRPGMI